MRATGFLLGDVYTTKGGRGRGGREVTLVGSDLGRHPIGLSLVECSVDDRSVLQRHLERKNWVRDWTMHLRVSLFLQYLRIFNVNQFQILFFVWIITAIIFLPTAYLSSLDIRSNNRVFPPMFLEWFLRLSLSRLGVIHLILSIREIVTGVSTTRFLREETFTSTIHERVNIVRKTPK